MLMPPKREALNIDGPVGPLESVLESSGERPPIGAAVVCHPHPLHGGTMHNKVAHTLARAFVTSDMVALRFNFRGVGESSGSFDDGRGEADDARAAIGYMRERFPDLPVWLGGFSFGAAMAIRVAGDEELEGLVSVAPASSRLRGADFMQPDCPWLIIHPEDDELVSIDETVDWVDSLAPGPEFVVFPETTHFFHGRLVELRETVRDFVQRQAGT